MSRTEKLFQRLDELEAEYRRLAAHEFARWSDGGWWYSLFLVDKLPFLSVLRYPPTAEQERLDSLLHVEKEIETLRLKMNQPMSESPVQKVRDAAALICAAHESGEGTEFKIASTLLKDLGYERQ